VNRNGGWPRFWMHVVAQASDCGSRG